VAKTHKAQGGSAPFGWTASGGKRTSMARAAPAATRRPTYQNGRHVAQNPAAAVCLRVMP
jgi:hypothetical protein